MKPQRMLDAVGLPSQLDVERRLFDHLKAANRPLEAQMFYDALADDLKLTQLAQFG
jgi:hypothetical protein